MPEFRRNIFFKTLHGLKKGCLRTDGGNAVAVKLKAAKNQAFFAAFFKNKTCLLIKAYSPCVPDAAGAAGDCFLPVMMRRRGENAIIAPAPIRVITNSGSI